MTKAKRTGHTYLVELTRDEVILLDGQCSGVVQAEVNMAKQISVLLKSPSVSGLTEAQVAMVCAVVHAALRCKLFSRVPRVIHMCACCAKLGGYAVYSRNSKHHSKGDTNYSNPIRLHGYDLNGFCLCTECMDVIFPLVLAQLDGAEVEISELGSNSKWKQVEYYECAECEWHGLSSEMGRLPTLMGNGTYPGVCPSCGAKKMLFGPERFKHTGVYGVIPNPLYKEKAE